MRTLDELRSEWQEVTGYRDLGELKRSVRLESSRPNHGTLSRSLCWKIFLIFDSLDKSLWQKTLSSSRSAYNTLRAHFLAEADRLDDFGAGLDPLSHDVESSPWTARRKDEELRVEIRQDVDRLPQKAFYQLPDSRRMLTDILFIFCKLNPDIGYRQGMHELAAPVLFVIDNDAINIGESSKALGEDAQIKSCFDAEHIEHDTFTLFGQVMQNAKSFYVSEGQSSIASRSKQIFEDLLPQPDPELAKHLSNLDVLPQVYLIRWIRLLFGREFEFEEVLAMWDIIFAEDPTLEIVNHVCIVMLLNIRWQLLDADYNSALSILLKYPKPGKGQNAQAFVTDALYLRTHMNADGAGYLVLKYTDRPLTRPGRPSTPPALQRNITTFSGLLASGSPGRKFPSSNRPRQTRNFEAMLQNTAKNIYEQSEKLGISKAVRSAVDEVHKKAQEIREAQAASPPPWRRPTPHDLTDKLHDLQTRNKQLARLLETAVNELWECQRTIVDVTKEASDDERRENAEKLSAAIAKAQFVQVYLDDHSLVLPSNEEDEKHQEVLSSGEEATQAMAAKSSATHEEKPPEEAPSILFGLDDGEEEQDKSSPVDELADPSSFEDDLITPQIEKAAPLPPSSGCHTLPTVVQMPTNVRNSTIEQSPGRPPLAQSNYSFMLGQSETLRENDPSTPDQNRAKTSLFGNDAASSSPRSKTKGNAFATGNTITVDEEAEFDMGSLRRARKANG